MKSNRSVSGRGQSWSRRTRHRIRYVFIVGMAAAGIALVAYFTLSDRQGGASAGQIAGATGTLTAPQVFYDFGRVSMKDGRVSTRYQVRNDSTAPALIEQISTSCMCTEASLLIGGERLGPFGMQGHGYTPRINQIVDAGQEAVVETVFDPNAHGPAGVGRNDRAVSLQLGGRRVLQLQFTAYVTP